MTWQIIKKEFLGYFYSPIGMIVLTVFTVISGLYFYSGVVNFLIQTTPSEHIAFVKGLNVNANLLTPFFSKILNILIIITPIVTMRLFAEEKRQGTLELLYSYPIKPVQLVLGKYLGALLFMIILLLISAPYPIYVIVFSEPNIASILTTYLGFLLLFSFYVAAGTFASTLTDNQIIAAIFCFAIALSFVVTHWLAVVLPSPFSEFFQHLMVFAHMGSFFEGVIFWGHTVVCPSLAVLFLYLSYKRIRVM